ncbi:hypothetical protein BDQ17DRAFT_1342106 [Cyathus striatus]|nr:hypothetical protein BDQ17DRAFT_1342106 [Cyathus striatus]
MLGSINPTEIIWIILQELDIRSLIKCREISRYILNLIDSSVLLNYEVELYAANLVEGPSSLSATTSARLKLLREHQKAWKLMNWKEKVHFTLPREDYTSLSAWEFRGGVLAFGEQRQLCFIQLPSPLRGIARKDWDLLVIIEHVVGQHDVQTSFRIHMLSLATGIQHPLAKKQTIAYLPNQLGTMWWYVVRICYDHVAVMFQVLEEGTCELVVWNWKTRELKKRVSGDIGAYIFLTKTLVMLGMTEEQDNERFIWSIEVVDIEAPNVPECAENIEATRLCSFQFPQIQSGLDEGDDGDVDLTIYTDYDTLSPPRKDISYPFCTDNEDALIAITPFSIPITPTSITFFLIRSHLLAAVQDVVEGKRSKILQWGKWEDVELRIMRVHTPMEWFCYIHGMKAIIPSYNTQEVFIYDFCPRSIKRNQLRDTEETMNVEYDMEASEDDFEYFAEPVKSTLPYMKTTGILPEMTNRADSAEFVIYCI